MAFYQDFNKKKMTRKDHLRAESKWEEEGTRYRRSTAKSEEQRRENAKDGYKKDSRPGKPYEKSGYQGAPKKEGYSKRFEEKPAPRKPAPKPETKAAPRRAEAPKEPVKSAAPKAEEPKTERGPGAWPGGLVAPGAGHKLSDPQGALSLEADGHPAARRENGGRDFWCPGEESGRGAGVQVAFDVLRASKCLVGR